MIPVVNSYDEEPIDVQQGQFGGRMNLSGGASSIFAGRMDRRPSLGAPSDAPPVDATVSDLLDQGTSLESAHDGAIDGPGNGMGRAERRDSLEATASELDAYIIGLIRNSSSLNDLPSDNDSGSQVLGQRSANSVLQTALAERQQQLQTYQAELENRQRALELQRQQLLAALQESSLHEQSSGISSEQPTVPRMVPPMASSYLRQQSMNDDALPFPHEEEVMAATESNQGSTSNQPQCQQWWGCRICKLAAFATRNDALDHEATCGSARCHETAAPTEALPQPVRLATNTDEDWLTALHCFVRRRCVEVFTACSSDVAHPAKGKRKPIEVGQVGIRCPFCHILGDPNNRERGNVYYPTTISNIYNATMNLLQRHFHVCLSVPDDIMEQYQALKKDDARSGISKRYWVQSALSLGLIDTPSGIRYSSRAPPPLPQLSVQQRTTKTGRPRHADDLFSTMSRIAPDSSPKDEEGIVAWTANDEQDGVDQPEPFNPKQAATNLPENLVEPDDKCYATSFSYELMRQTRACCFTEADRIGKRKGLPPGYAGLACRHCFGEYGSGRFFPSSIKTLSDTSKTLNPLHKHMRKCPRCPPQVTSTLDKLRFQHDEERSKMKFGSQKAFFIKIWGRLHGPEDKGDHRSNSTQRRNSQARHDYEQVPAPVVQESAFSDGFADMGGMMGLGGLDVLSMQAALAAREEEPPSKRHRST